MMRKWPLFLLFPLLIVCTFPPYAQASKGQEWMDRYREDFLLADSEMNIEASILIDIARVESHGNHRAFCITERDKSKIKRLTSILDRNNISFLKSWKKKWKKWIIQIRDSGDYHQSLALYLWDQKYENFDIGIMQYNSQNIKSRDELIKHVQNPSFNILKSSAILRHFFDYFLTRVDNPALYALEAYNKGYRVGKDFDYARRVFSADLPQVNRLLHYE